MSRKKREETKENRTKDKMSALLTFSLPKKSINTFFEDAAYEIEIGSKIARYAASHAG